MNYIYKDNQSEYTIILFHGTGGDAKGMLPLGMMLDDKANLLSIEGNVSENGMKRFFKRFALGNYDLPNLYEETDNLNETLEKLTKTYNLNKEKTLLMGYSNGANILQNYIRVYPDTFKNYAFLHSSLLEDKDFPNLENLSIYLSNSVNDPIVPKIDSDRLLKLLNEASANIHNLYTATGHNLSKITIDDLKNWYETTLKG